MREHYFATCPRGLEGVLADELAASGAAEIAPTEGGVAFSGDLALCYRANLESRVASRVLWRVCTAPYRGEQDIYAAVRAVRWDEWFSPARSLRVNVAAVRSPVKSLEFVTLRVKDAICDAFRAASGRRPNVDTLNPDVRIHAFLTTRELSVYVDTSGDALFKRGYRTAAGSAPLRENLAAGILQLAGWRADRPLLDPMCGSGTILCEAAMIALRIPPGLNRRFGFERLVRYDAALWRVLRDQARDRILKVTPARIYGSDRYGDVLKLARANLAALGMGALVELKQANVLELPPPAASGLLVTNPPYGVRLSEQQELAAFYPRLGDALKRKFAGWTAHILSADTRLPKLIGLKPARRIPLFNGALECRLFEFRLVAGPMRRPAMPR